MVIKIFALHDKTNSYLEHRPYILKINKQNIIVINIQMRYNFRKALYYKLGIIVNGAWEKLRSYYWNVRARFNLKPTYVVLTRWAFARN